MTPEQFIAIWKNNPLTERAGAQAHFDDLCELLGVEKPRDPDNYCFERGAKKSSGGDGWADVWKRRFFGWENKKPGRPLDGALKQLTDYSLQLDNPPLLVVCDRERIVIHTAFTGYPDEPREILIDDLIDPEKRQILRWVFTDPEKLRPEKSTAAITAEAAGQFAQLAAAMRGRGESDPNSSQPLGQHNGQRVAHFLVQCLFCMFAEDEALLPAGVFTQLLGNAGVDADKAGRRIEKLFLAMQTTGGEYGDHDIPWFNGGLFKTVDVPLLLPTDLAALHRAAAEMDWRAIDPTIFGTLFERGLDPAARAPLGAHYTDTGTIEKLIRPVITEPLLAEWVATKAEMLARPKKAKAAYQTFLLRLNHFRVLDPACGSGNFLYLALKALRDIEKQAHIEALELGQSAELSMQTGPHNILGLEINEFAAELARVTVWIGDIQWCRRNGYPHAINPILKPLDGIEHRDALLVIPAQAGMQAPLTTQSGDAALPTPELDSRNHSNSGAAVEADWPTADVIVGNPPFLGGSVMRGELGDEYVETLRRVYASRVPGGADLVTYWFEKARAQIEVGKLKAAGLVATNSIRGGANRKVLERIVESTRIFEAWSDEEWVNEGAAVRVSLVAFGFLPSPAGGGGAGGEGLVAHLDGQLVAEIHADLTAGEGVNLTQAKRLLENAAVCFEGIKKYGPFDVPGETARAWLASTGNPNGRSNADVLHPWINATDVVRNNSDTWVIDFTGLSVIDAALYEAPFQFALENVQPARAQDRNTKTREQWWLYERPRLEMRKALTPLSRFIVTPVVAKHRIFAWRSTPTLAMNLLDVIARADDTTFGILHSRFHELWSLRMGTSLEDRPRYTPTTTFETFPFPAGLTPRDTAVTGSLDAAQRNPGTLRHESPDSAALHPGYACANAGAIAAAAKRLNELRENWLNPSEWVDWVITPEEEKAGFPKRPVAKPGHEAELKKRTLTNLYNAKLAGKAAWLDMAHKQLDQTVAAAYGWTDYTPEMPDEEILRRLLALNLERAACPATA